MAQIQITLHLAFCALEQQLQKHLTSVSTQTSLARGWMGASSEPTRTTLGL